MQNNNESYTSANTMPSKLFHNEVFLRGIYQKNRINPIHLQLIPTNKCNLKCSFCSFSDADKTLELSFDQIDEIFSIGAHLGTKALTITGGGEPLMHPDINDIILRSSEYLIEPGLVTNGILINRLDPYVADLLTWCRISASDERILSEKNEKEILELVEKTENCDWAFSYVIQKRSNLNNIIDYIEIVNSSDKFTHIRLVRDLLDIYGATNIEIIKQELIARKIDISKVIFQSRNEWTHGFKNCWISLLKPLIGADGYVYGCCGTMYARHDIQHDLVDQFRMGHYSELKDIIKNQKCFNGSICEKCYYDNYNQCLSAWKTTTLQHENFV